MRTLTRLLSISVLILLPRWGQSCLPDFPQVIFTRPAGPDKPMSKFTGGRIGVPLPTWRRAFLVVAYRYLDGKPLSAAEQRSLLEFFDSSGVRDRQRSDTAVERWLRERGKYQSGPKPMISTYQTGSSPYYGYQNCLAPAFNNAVQVLQARAKEFGPQSVELREWISGQDVVFENCHGGPLLPSALPENANTLLRADRAYQTAAADFYSSRLPDALREFDAIGKDTSSPWHLVASYMAARTIIRQASAQAKPGTDEEYNPGILALAEPRLAAITSAPEFGSLRKDAERLQALLRFHLHPGQRQHDLAHILLSGHSGSDFGQQLLDYKLLLDRFLDATPEFDDGPSWGPEYDARVRIWKRKLYSKLTRERSDALSDWLMTLQSGAEDAKLHAINKWRTTASTPWLFAAMLKLEGKEQSVPDVLRAASQVPETSPAFAAISFHRSRLLRESGRPDEARKVTEAALRQAGFLPPSALNLLKDEQMRNSPDLESLLPLLARNPSEVTAGPDTSGEDSYCYYDHYCNIAFYGVSRVKPNTPLLPQFDLSAAEMLNKRLPVGLLAEVAASDSLPQNLRQRLATSAWARAALLGDSPVAQKAGEIASKVRPELAPFIDQYTAAQTENERQFVAVFAIVHFPGLRPFVDDGYPRLSDFKKIDDYRDNWWCSDVGGIPEDLNFEKQYGDNPRTVAELENRLESSSPVFLTAGQRATASSEWKQILSMGLAADYLPREVLAWAKVHPDDPRVPEALHYAWRADRYGCSDSRENIAANNWSRDIFKLLHKRYPNSEWAKRTRVW